MTTEAPTENLERVQAEAAARVLVAGSGPVAAMAAQELVKIGYGVILCCATEALTFNPPLWGSKKTELADDTRIEILAPAEILQVDGSAGDFLVKLKANNGVNRVKEVGAVLLAHDAHPKTNFEAWGVDNPEKVKPLSWLESRLSSPQGDLSHSGGEPSQFVFICGFTHLSNPYSQKRALEAAVELVREGRHMVIFLVDHFKVAEHGMERLTLKAREAGVLFVKLTGERPELKSEADKVTVSYDDPELQERVKVSPDFLILEEAYEADEELAKAAEKLGLTVDQKGFFKDDNIHIKPVQTNTAGIWVVGPARRPASLTEAIEETRAAALEIHEFFAAHERAVLDDKVLFDQNRCGKCLTCYRTCPHQAISYLEMRPLFHATACKSCGICAAACPMEAIQIPGFGDSDIRSRIANIAPDADQEKEHKRLLVFCCQNSAADSARLALLEGLTFPAGLELVKVPCAGRVDVASLLKAFELGADGVMIVGCHPESCKSVTGTFFAKRRIEVVRDALGQIELETDRISFGSCAPGMSSEFVKIIKGMDHLVRSLG